MLKLYMNLAVKSYTSQMSPMLPRLLVNFLAFP